ncbi:hypothetical protein L525_3503 [Bordetella bronchiseptica MBORD782]|nr:hypothetical protein L525_3503 [Bordetella bronchiseptica MBORD782]
MVNNLFAGAIYGDKQGRDLAFLKSRQAQSEDPGLKQDLFPTVQWRLRFQAGIDILVAQHHSHRSAFAMFVDEGRMAQFKRIEHDPVLRRTGVGFL